MTDARSFLDAVLWANTANNPQTRLRRLAILSWLSGNDRDRFPTQAALAASLGMTRQAAHKQVDDLKAFCAVRAPKSVDEAA